MSGPTATANPDNRLGGVAPWFALPGTAATWNAASSYSQGSASNFPRFEDDRLRARIESGVYGHQPRVIWTAPEAGKVSFGGTFGFGTSDNSARSVEWVFARRSGGNYEVLASGTTATPATEPLYSIGSSQITSAGKTCYLRYPLQGGAPITTPCPLVVVGHGAGGNGTGSAGIYQHLAAEGYLVVAPSFGTSYNPSTYSNDVSNIITDLLGRSDLPVSINADRIGYSGTSMGGIIGLAKFRIDRYDPRIKAIYVRAANTDLVGGTYDWSVATPLLFLHGDADTTVRIGPALDDYAAAYPPKAFITLAGVTHDLSFANAGSFYEDVCEGFFDFFLKGDQGGLDRVVTACNANPTPSIQTDWASAIAPEPLEVSNYPGLIDIVVDTGEELIWSFRPVELASPDTDCYMRDEPLTMIFTPGNFTSALNWQQY